MKQTQNKMEIKEILTDGQWELTHEEGTIHVEFMTETHGGPYWNGGALHDDTMPVVDVTILDVYFIDENGDAVGPTTTKQDKEIESLISAEA
jgi:hypothetical protein